MVGFYIGNLFGCVRLGSIRNKNNWNNASKRLFGSYSYSRIPGFPFRLFCSQEQNSRNIFRNIFLFRNIPNEPEMQRFCLSSLDSTLYNYQLLDEAEYDMKNDAYRGGCYPPNEAEGLTRVTPSEICISL